MTTTEAVVPPRRGDGDPGSAALRSGGEAEDTGPRALGRTPRRGEAVGRRGGEAGAGGPTDSGDGTGQADVRSVSDIRPTALLERDPLSAPLHRRATDHGDGLGPRRPAYDPFSARRRPVPEWLMHYTGRLVAGDAFGALLGVLATRAFLPPSWQLDLSATTLLVLAWCAAVAVLGGYAERHLGSGVDEYRCVGTAGLALVAGLGVALQLHVPLDARGLLLVGVPVAFGVTLIVRNALRRSLHRARRRGYMRKEVVLVGRSASVLDLAQRLRRDPDAGYAVLGACVPDPDSASALRREGVSVLGSLDHVPQVLDNVRADAVVVASASETAAEYLRRLAWQLEGTNIEVLVAPGLVEVAPDRLRVRPTKSVPLLHVREPEYRGHRRLIKSLLDRVLAGVLLVLSLPVLVTVAVLVRLDSRGPVFYRHRRIGKRGREFDLLKFRSMLVDADKKQEQLAPLSEGNEVQFKMRRDPRVTRVGHVLRRYSVDELPQLINVVKGDMSLVGPRPHVTREVEQYGDDMHRRLLVKPGITGLWQVSGRSDLTWEESVELDVRYVDNWSLGRDVGILWRTARAVLRGSGAY